MVNRLSVYISESFDVYKNLATEKYLFDNVACDEIILYLWQNDNAVVLGRNQNIYAECNVAYAKENSISIARRLSGGGAVFHDLGNLNYTFISYKENCRTEKNMQIVAAACDMSGIETQISGRNDIVCKGRKFSGNAFYDSGGKACHHGTIMVNSDIEKMQRVLTPSLEKLLSKGIKSVKSRVMNLCEKSPLLTCGNMKEYLIRSFENAYMSKAYRIEIPDESTVLQKASEYACEEFVFGKSPAFSFSVTGKFGWGSIEIMPEIKNGYITDVNVYTDALLWQLSDVIKESLLGSEFLYDSVVHRLSGVLEQEYVRDICCLLFKTML